MTDDECRQSFERWFKLDPGTNEELREHKRLQYQAWQAAWQQSRADASEGVDILEGAKAMAQSKYKCPWNNLSKPTKNAYIARAKATATAWNLKPKSEGK